MMDDPKHPLEESLNNLGEMRTKRGNDAFKNQLRAKLSEKAEAMASEPKRAWNFDWNKFGFKRLVPAVSGALVLVLLLQVLIGPGSRLNLPIELVNVAEAQEYYTLTPTDEDVSGVDNLAHFTLESKGELKAEDIAEVLTVTPETTFHVDQVDRHTVVLIPDTALESGELYQIELAAQNLKDAPYKKTFRWAYTVSETFKITGTSPGQEGTGVPTNTGIEISFTHEGVDENDLAAHFSLSPEVSGSFSVEDKVATFVPKEGLLPTTIYTATLEADLPLAGTDQTLGEDYVWQFETGDGPKTKATLYLDHFVTISPDQGNLIPISAYDSSSNEEERVDVDVYQYEDFDEYLTAIQAYRNSVPSWAYAAEEQYQSNVSSLNQVMSATDLGLTELNYREHVPLPQALEEGYYLMEVRFRDTWEQAFVQVTNTATYFSISDETSVFWVNDIASGSPVKGAKITIESTGESYVTNSEGIAVIKDIFGEESEDRSRELHVQVDSDQDSTYFEKNYRSYYGSAHDLAWTILETDLGTYRPDDTVHFWGMVQGREEPINGEAVFTINGGGETTVDIVDGQIFTGELELVEAATGYHTIELSMDGESLATDHLIVENYVLPAYEIDLSSQRNAYFAGETITVNIDAHFFDGTPVAHTELRVSDPDDTDHYLTTDENGLASFSWKSNMRLEKCSETYCDLKYSANFDVYPVQEELGDTSEYMSIDVYRSDIAVDTGMRPTHDSWEFVAYDVDLDKSFNNDVSSGYYFYFDEHISENVATHGSIDYQIQRQDVSTYTEEYYDETDKVTYQDIKTKTEWVNVGSGTLMPDADGTYLIDYDLDLEHAYRIYIEVDDGTAGYYKENVYLPAAYTGIESPYISIEPVDAPRTGYSIGEEVTLQIFADDTPIDTEDDRFLFIHAQEGIIDYELSENGTHNFDFDEEDIPNVTVIAARFDGQGFQNASSETIYFDKTDRNLEVSASVDQESYAPGDTVTLTIDADRAASVQIQLVDEAYYSLYDEDLINPLNELYQSLRSGIDVVFMSHKSEEVDGGKGGCFVAGTQILMADGSTKNIQDIEVGDEILTREDPRSNVLVSATVASLHQESVRETLLVNGHFGLTDNHVIFLNGKWTEAKKMQVGDWLLNANGEREVITSIEHVQDTKMVYNFEVEDLHTYFADGHYVHNEKGDSVRADFPTTAYFGATQTDSSGHATVSFEIADSITEWRAQVVAIAPGDEIYAGSTSTSVIVTKDAFVVPILSQTYLAGDTPSIPVRAYGDALDQGESVSFSVESEALGLGATVVGEAFTTSYFDIEALQEGSYDFVFGLDSEAGDDAVALETEVLESYFRLPQQSETTLKDGVSLKGSDSSRSDVLFLNMENGPVFWNLMWVLRQDGNRVDEALGRSLAAEWLNEIFGQEEGEIKFYAGLYQNVEEGGGISLFPYADADLELSAELAALAPERFNTSSLTSYFHSYLYGEATLTQKMQSLYGLAGLGKNVLLEARIFEREFELDDEDKLWLALAYAEMGAGDDVTRLYLEIDRDDFEGEALMLMTMLADYVASDERETLYENALKEDQFNLLPSMLYSKQRLSHVSGDPVSFKLNGETIEIEAHSVEWRNFTSKELDDAEITHVDGEILAISSYWDYEDPSQIKTSDALSIERWYEVDGVKVSKVSAGDVVEVHFKLSLPDNKGYRVVDYLPSGLQSLTPAHRSWISGWRMGLSSPYQTEKQEMSFYVSCAFDKYQCGDYEFFYIARVVNPGGFTMQPALLQKFSDLDMAALSEGGWMEIQK